MVPPVEVGIAHAPSAKVHPAATHCCAAVCCAGVAQ